MAEKQTATVPEAIDVIQKAKGFWTKYSKRIIIAGSVLLVLGGSYLGYKYFYKLPREEKASELIFPAERLYGKMAASSSFNKDTLNVVLNGGVMDGANVTGLLKIVSKYSGTASANRAEYIVGACYLQVKEFDKAIKHLKNFEGNDASQVQSKAYTMLGHAYAEKKNTDEALSYYKKAASVNEKDEATTTFALMLAGMYAESVGKTKEAIELFQKLRDNYPASVIVQAGDPDKYLARLGVTK